MTDLPLRGNGYAPMLQAATDTISRGELENSVHPWSDVLDVFDVIDRVRDQLTTADSARSSASPTC